MRSTKRRDKVSESARNHSVKFVESHHKSGFWLSSAIGNPTAELQWISKNFNGLWRISMTNRLESVGNAMKNIQNRRTMIPDH